MWFLWALGASFCAAILAECNRKFQLEARVLNAWRASFAAMMIAFAWPIMVWPDLSVNRNFYTVAGVDGIVTAIGMIMFLSLAAKKTGRVTSMVMPIAAIGAFATWWLIVPSQRINLMDQPVQTMIAIFSLLIIFISLQKIRRNDNSWESFVIVLPVGLAFGMTDALTKWVLYGAHGMSGLAIAYTFLSMSVCAVIAWVVALPKPAGGHVTSFLSAPMLWGGFWCGFWTAGMYLALTFSLTLADNPTYPGIIMALTPIWLYLLNQLRQTHDDVNPLAGLAIIAGAVGLLLSTL